MWATGNDIIDIIEEFAPLNWALSGDNCGLQWGDPNCPVESVLLALDFGEAVLNEAILTGANFIFTHHPFLYKPLSGLDLREQRAALLARALKEGVILYSAHSNLDVAPRGVSHALGTLLGLEEMVVLHPTGRDALEKLVVFIPDGYEDKVRAAIVAAGAGWIGNYSHCTFQSAGTGTFLPREGTRPFIGCRGVVEKTGEYRLETIVPASKREAVLAAMRLAHPYEEVAFDLYPVLQSGEARGLGRTGVLPEAVRLDEFALKCRELLQPRCLRMLGTADKSVRRVAVLGGSGAAYLPVAIKSGAHVFISGDIGYHDAQHALSAGLALLDAGHSATERPIIPVIAGFLTDKLRENGFLTKVIMAQEEELPWITLI